MNDASMVLLMLMLAAVTATPNFPSHEVQDRRRLLPGWGNGRI